MAMQAIDYRLGVNIPREGDVRREWDAANDCSIFYVWTNGRWIIASREYRLAQRVQCVTFTTTNPPVDANARALTLLRSQLSPTQRAQFEAKGWFEVIGGKTGRTYRVDRHSWPGRNVTRWQDGSPRISYCARPTPSNYSMMLMGDTLLAQKLALENPEREIAFTDMACKVDYSDYGAHATRVYGIISGYGDEYDEVRRAQRRRRQLAEHPAFAVLGCFLIAVLMTLIFLR